MKLRGWEMLDENASLADAGARRRLDLPAHVPPPARRPLSTAASSAAPRARPLARPTPDALRDAPRSLRAEVQRRIVGQETVLDEILMALIAGGHALLVGVPGLAKTLHGALASPRRCTSTSGASSSRPTWCRATSPAREILEEDHATGARSFRFVRGPIFANIVLADEINRAPPRTQAALLEAMQEHSVTAAGETMRAARAVLRARHAEPDRAGGHVSAARSAARPLPVRHPRRLSDGRRGGRDPARARPARRARRSTPMLGAAELLALQRLTRDDRRRRSRVLRYAATLVRATRPDDASARRRS